MENPFADKLRGLDNTDYGRLPFEEQCAFFGALKLGVPRIAVAKAAGVSQATVSLMLSAGETRGGKLRYAKVAREYETLGHEAFIHRYLTPPLRERLDRAIDAWKIRIRNPDMNARGFNPKANAACGRYEWPETSIGLHAIFRIELHPDGNGYFWRNLKPRYDQPEVPADEVPYNPECAIVGDPERGPERGPNAKGFPTSKACFAHVRRLMNPSAAQMAEAVR